MNRIDQLASYVLNLVEGKRHLCRGISSIYGYRLKRRQGSGRRVDTIPSDTAALLIRKVDYVLGWMKAVVTGT